MLYSLLALRKWNVHFIPARKFCIYRVRSRNSSCLRVSRTAGITRDMWLANNWSTWNSNFQQCEFLQIRLHILSVFAYRVTSHRHSLQRNTVSAIQRLRSSAFFFQYEQWDVSIFRPLTTRFADCSGKVSCIRLFPSFSQLILNWKNKFWEWKRCDFIILN